MCQPRFTLPHIDKTPLEIVVERGGAIESEYLVDLAVVNAEGDVIVGFGDLERPIFQRSAIKLLQSIQCAEWCPGTIFTLNQRPYEL